MPVKSGQAWAGLFVMLDATGAKATPSVGPAGTLYVDGTSNAASVTITGSNPYKFAVTLPSLTAGQTVSMYITATIDGVATASVVAMDTADTLHLSDAYTAIVGATAVRRGVALSNLKFLMTLNRTPVTGATVTSLISKDSGAFGSTTNSVSEIGNGIYSISLTATEMTAQTVTLRFTATGCDDLVIAIPVGN